MREHRREPEAVAFEDEIHGSAQDLADANALAWQEVKSELLRHALERLPTEYREVIVLHEIEGLSYREISRVSDIPIGTVMSRLARARGKLQTELATLTGKDSPHGL
jgi:RNA polymerase sigma-70 factor (ECF subfamily)